MIIVNIEYPGMRLELTEKDKSCEIQGLILSMEDALMDMAITLSMFRECQQKLQSETAEMRSRWEQDRQLWITIENEYQSTFAGLNDYYLNYKTHRAEIEKRFRAAKLEAGEVPNRYKHRYRFIHAHGFLAAADTFSKFLRVVNEETELPFVSDLLKEFNEALPTLRGVRNSSQHMEDRSRGYGKPANVTKKQKMDLKPVENNFIKAERGDCLVLSVLNGNKLGYTVDDGSYQEFEISSHTLDFVTDIFQRFINGFQWSGPPISNPNF